MDRPVNHCLSSAGWPDFPVLLLSNAATVFTRVVDFANWAANEALSQGVALAGEFVNFKAVLALVYLQFTLVLLVHGVIRLVNHRLSSAGWPDSPVFVVWDTFARLKRVVHLASWASKEACSSGEALACKFVHLLSLTTNLILKITLSLGVHSFIGFVYLIFVSSIWPNGFVFLVSDAFTSSTRIIDRTFWASDEALS